MSSESATRRERVAGCLIGSAIGDSWGWQTEFMSLALIMDQWPPDGPDLPTRDKNRPNVFQVTDDTQMALAVGEALVAAHANGPFTAKSVEPELRRTFVDWFVSPENNRAPGHTCMGACRKLQDGATWLDATRPASKGCGANMRVAPVGLLPDAWTGSDDETRRRTRSALSQFQAAMTHGHAAGLAAADLTAETVYLLLNDCDPDDLVPELRAYAESQREIYHEDWLDLSPREELWDRAEAGSPTEFIASGWDACLALLDDVEYAVKYKSADRDPCDFTGQGWVADEAFATSLLCFLWFPEDPLTAVKRAVVTAGDSDSLACLTGAYCGARFGQKIWPAEWAQAIEYRDRLEALSAAFSE